VSLRVLWAIAKKDLLEALKTLRLLIFVLLPLGFSLFYRIVFSSAGDVTIPRVVIFDAGASRLPQVLVQMADVRVVMVGSVGELERVVLGAGAVGGLALPPGYDAALAAGKRPALRLFVNGQLGVNATQLIHLIEPSLRALAGQRSPAHVETLALDADSHGKLRPRFDLDGFLLVMFLTTGLAMTAAMVPASMLVEEKERRTLVVIETSPASYADLIAGKGIAGSAFALLSGGLILALNGGLRGQIGLTLLVLLFSALFFVGVGLLLGAAFESSATLNAWSLAVLLPLTLPGVLVPASDLGLLNLGAAAWVVRVVPTYYLVDAVQWAVNGAADLSTIGADLAVLAISCFALMGLAVVWLRRREP
jgi:ABC-2 type transport system permease protein